MRPRKKLQTNLSDRLITAHDLFAMCAIIGLTANRHRRMTDAQLAVVAYDIADEMYKEKNKREVERINATLDRFGI